MIECKRDLDAKEKKLKKGKSREKKVLQVGSHICFVYDVHTTGERKGYGSAFGKYSAEAARG